MNWLMPAHFQSCLNRWTIGDGGGGGSGAATVGGTTLRGMLGACHSRRRANQTASIEAGDEGRWRPSADSTLKGTFDVKGWCAERGRYDVCMRLQSSRSMINMCSSNGGAGMRMGNQVRRGR